MKFGQRVHLKFHPETWGTVSAVLADGRFRVTWFTEGRKPREPRARFWYTQEARLNIIGSRVPA